MLNSSSFNWIYNEINNVWTTAFFGIQTAKETIVKEGRGKRAHNEYWKAYKIWSNSQSDIARMSSSKYAAQQIIRRAVSLISFPCEFILSEDRMYSFTSILSLLLIHSIRICRRISISGQIMSFHSVLYALLCSALLIVYVRNFFSLHSSFTLCKSILVHLFF